MPDLADDRAAYREAMARAEAAVGIERDADGTELNGIEAFVRGETPDATPAEGAVQVSASDQPLPPEPAAETTDTSVVQQEAVPAAEPTVEELKAQLAASEARIEEQKQMIGRQSTEVSETRGAIEKLEARIAAAEVARATPQAPPVQITQELIDTNPAQAANIALKQGDEQTLEFVWEQWKEVDSEAAKDWLRDRQREADNTKHAAEVEALRQEIAANNAVTAESANDKSWREAITGVMSIHPDFLESSERILSVTVEEYPEFKAMLESGNTKDRTTALAALYALDKIGNPEETKAALAEAAAEAATEAAAARSAATVTSQTEAGQPAEQKTVEELEAEAYQIRANAKPSLAKGWTGRG
jgi:hypothetical protein